MDIEFHAGRMQAAAQGLTSLSSERLQHGVPQAVGQGHTGDMLNAACAVWQANIDATHAATQDLAASVHSAIAAMQATESSNAANAASVRHLLP